jgi:hypothetical protein
MVGMVVWTAAERGRRAVALTERRCLQMRFACAEVVRSPRTPEAVLRRRVQAAARRLNRLGVDRAVLPGSFGYLPQLAKYGVRPVSTLALRRALAAEWVRAAAEARGLEGVRVAVAAAQLTGEVVRTVTELSLRHRYVLLDLPYGGEDLCRQLRRAYGVSVLLGPSKEQLEGAEVLVLFDPRTDLTGKNPVVLPLYDEAAPLPELTLPPALEAALPGGVDRGELLAALQGAGALKAGQIGVKETFPLDILKSSLYNTTL